MMINVYRCVGQSIFMMMANVRNALSLATTVHLIKYASVAKGASLFILIQKNAKNLTMIVQVVACIVIKKSALVVLKEEC